MSLYDKVKEKVKEKAKSAITTGITGNLGASKFIDALTGTSNKRKIKEDEARIMAEAEALEESTADAELQAKADLEEKKKQIRKKSPGRAASILTRKPTVLTSMNPKVSLFGEASNRQG